jgi:hypothetical protein
MEEVKIPLDDLRVFKRFIDQAERVWTQIATSPLGKVVFTVNGVDFTPLPERYNTKRKISRIFRRYWGKSLTETMIRNLNLRLLKGKLCVPHGVIPPFPTTVQSVLVKSNRPNQKVVSAILTGGNKKVRVDYRFVRAGASASFTIMKRSGREFDLRYRPPASAQTKAKSKQKPKPKGKKKLLKTP